jgi:hypothetical protein
MQLAHDPEIVGVASYFLATLKYNIISNVVMLFAVKVMARKKWQRALYQTVVELVPNGR